MKNCLQLILFLLALQTLTAQDETNLQSFIGAYMLPVGDVELKMFNNLYTQAKFFNEKMNVTDDNRRSTFYTNFIQATYGLNSRINVGLDFQVKSVLYDENFGSALDVFKFGSSINERTELAYVGPKVRWMPFKYQSNIAIQSTLFIPVASNLEGDSTTAFLDHDGYQWWNELFYSKDLSSKFNFFGSLGAIWKIDKSESQGLASFTTPIKVFINFFPDGNWTLYSSMELAPTYGDGFVSAFYFQEGLGIKRSLGPSFELEGLYTNFIAGKNAGGGETFNLGLRKVF